jgi:hypothetical protein
MRRDVIAALPIVHQRHYLPLVKETLLPTTDVDDDEILLLVHVVWRYPRRPVASSWAGIESFFVQCHCLECTQLAQRSRRQSARRLCQHLPSRLRILSASQSRVGKAGQCRQGHRQGGVLGYRRWTSAAALVG